MKPFSLIFAGILGIAGCVATAGAATPPELDKQAAEKIVQEQIGTLYFSLLTGDQPYSSASVTAEKLADILKGLDIYKQAGLIDYTNTPTELIESAAGTTDSILRVILTDQGKQQSVRCITTSNQPVRGMPVGTRKVTAFHSLDADHTAEFDFHFTPNAAGKGLGYAEADYRGRATLAFDPAINNYRFTSFGFRNPQDEQWAGKSPWTYKTHLGETVCTW